MARYIINGGKTLHGTIRVHGAKNAVLPLFAGSILTEDQTIISNCPNLSDVQNMGKILTHLGADLIREGSNVFIDAKNLTSYEIPCKLAKEIRSSVFLLGSVLSRMKKAIIPYPGGCDIGARPIDLHIKALRDLNCEVEESYGYILCDSTNLKPREISLSYPSVGATENVMLLTAISSGVTVLNNSAEEPEIEELQSFLNQMGARIEGAGTSQIRIEGVKKLSGTAYEAMPDRIVAGTYLTMVASAGGSVLLKGVNPKHIAPVIQLLRDAGASIIECGDSLKIYSRGRLNAFGEI
ncbi:MAG: UDP-N-acetylglucosamine 1-carboxyvinyltransferase, partial [Firmicutes bacterium]|nr:UDP-N-acetylglucosamine 1-carboxyvinyltransferase [Bacillota bacterium]